MKSKPVLDATKAARTGPIVAWKIAHVYVMTEDPEVLRFSPIMHRDTTYGVREKAECFLETSHRYELPVDKCRCGFNAWHDLERAYEYMVLDERHERFKERRGIATLRRSNHAFLRVSLYGDVIEGTYSSDDIKYWGYRAAYQRIEDVFLRENCYLCGRTARHLGTINEEKFFNMDCLQLRPFCDLHAETATHSVIQSAALERRNNTRVHIGYPSE
jgi:hypothetical protein